MAVEGRFGATLASSLGDVGGTWGPSSHWQGIGPEDRWRPDRRSLHFHEVVEQLSRKPTSADHKLADGGWMDKQSTIMR